MRPIRTKVFPKCVSLTQGVIILMCVGTISLFILVDRLNERDTKWEASARARLGRVVAKPGEFLRMDEKGGSVIGRNHIHGGVGVDLKRGRQGRVGGGEDVAKGIGNGGNVLLMRDSKNDRGPERKTRPAVLRDALGNFEVPDRPRRRGPGENGQAVKLDPSEQEAYNESIKTYGFNVVVSDRISLDRSVPDIRHGECKYWHYPEDLPTASVVIVFHDEGWSTLLRTVHSVFNSSPSQLLAEVVLVDDFSDKQHLKSRLDDYIQDPRFDGKIKMVRNQRREGLIRSRIIGAEKSLREGVLVFLDAHCECNRNWLPPLLSRIALERTTVACPIVDSIDADTFAYGPQLDGICRGAFDWELYYKRIPLGEVEKKRRKYESEPYPSPVMAGGLFAIDRSYFFELGAYDPGLKIWGAEQYELSFKIWMCGGSLVFVPCSRVAHVYRKSMPYTYSEDTGAVSVVHRKYMRVVEVWMDDYKAFFYANQPALIGQPYGDISEQVAFRKEHCRKSFQWYLDEVAYDLLPNYPLPSPNKYWGEIRALDTSLCLDTMGRTENGRVDVGSCHGLGGNQLFRINEAGEFRIYDMCLFAFSKSLILNKCKGIRQNWDYNEETKMVVEVPLDICLSYNSEKHTVSMQRCDESKASQKWEIRNNFN